MPEQSAPDAEKSPKETVDYLNDLALEFKDKSPSNAVEFCVKAEKIAERINYLHGLSLSRMIAGRCLWQLKHFDYALQKFSDALKSFTAAGDEDGQMTACHIIANALLNLKLFPKAIPFYRQSLELSRKLDEKGFEAICLAGLGSAYEKMGDKNLSQQFYQKSMEVNAVLNEKKALKKARQLL